MQNAGALERDPFALHYKHRLQGDLPKGDILSAASAICTVVVLLQYLRYSPSVRLIPVDEARERAKCSPIAPVCDQRQAHQALLEVLHDLAVIDGGEEPAICQFRPRVPRGTS